MGDTGGRHAWCPAVADQRLVVSAVHDLDAVHTLERATPLAAHPHPARGHTTPTGSDYIVTPRPLARPCTELYQPRVPRRLQGSGVWLQRRISAAYVNNDSPINSVVISPVTFASPQARVTPWALTSPWSLVDASHFTPTFARAGTGETEVARRKMPGSGSRPARIVIVSGSCRALAHVRKKRGRFWLRDSTSARQTGPGWDRPSLTMDKIPLRLKPRCN